MGLMARKRQNKTFKERSAGTFGMDKVINPVPELYIYCKIFCIYIYERIFEGEGVQLVERQTLDLRV